jgi:dihydropyrimidinase
MFDLVVRNATIATAEATYRASVGVVDGRVAALSPELGEAEVELDAAGLVLAPGGIDVHTHFEHYVTWIGARNADTFESGTRAAAAGGITTIVNFAFQEQGRSLREAVESELEHADGQAHIDYGLHLVPTDLSVEGTLEQITSLSDEGFASIKIFTTIGDYRLPDEDILKILALAEPRGLLVNVHAEDDALITHLTDLHLASGMTGVQYLPLSRPPLAEAIATGRVAAYARHLGAPVYFVHLSSAEALDAVRSARATGAEIYVETRPVYLYLDQSRYALPDAQGNKWVCLPPLRSRDNQQALWAGMRSGEIQTYATDHAPWQSGQKLKAEVFPRIPAGVSNVQTSIGMLYAEGVAKNRISLSQFVALTSTNPAKLFGMWPRKGTITIGADADFMLIDPAKEVRVESDAMESAADYDPYDGYEGVGWPITTISRGEIIYEEGKVLSHRGRGRLLQRSRFMRL